MKLAAYLTALLPSRPRAGSTGMSNRYRPCEHRHPYNQIGSEEPVYYDTPCERCEEEPASTEPVSTEPVGLSFGTAIGLFLAAVAVIVVLLLSACGGGGSSVAPAAPAPSAPPDTRVYQVAAYGDSTQFELGDPHPAGAPGMWVKNKAYGGASAASMLAGYLDKGLPWAQEMAAQKAPVVVFNPGINDYPYTVDQYRENLRSLVTIAQAAGKFVILEQPNPAGEVETPLMASIGFDVAAFEARRQAMRDLATHMGVYFCAQPRVSLRDGIHPDEAGYAVKVQRLHACLLDAV